MTDITSAEEAFAVLDNANRYAVVVNDGEELHFLGRNRFNTYVLNTWIIPIAARREVRVTSEQAKLLIEKGLEREDDNAVRIVPYNRTPLECPHIGLGEE